MPSQKPRLALTLPHDLDVALTNLAKALRKPVSTVTVEMLVEMVPQLESLTKYHLAAKSGNAAAAKRALAHMVGDNMADLMSAQQPELFRKRK